jgi:3-dehydroquinate dehydratase-2
LPRLWDMTASLVYVLNGPNLNRLGSREPDIYGSETLENIADLVSREAVSLGLTVDFRQTNDEAELIDWIHEAVDRGADVVLNPAAFTHYSYAVRDACALVTAAGTKLIEIHLSNPATREEFRHTSVIAGVATGTIAGFGSGSYLLALRAMKGDLL